MKELLLLKFLFPVIYTALAPGEIRRLKIEKKKGNSWTAKISQVEGHETIVLEPFNLNFTHSNSANLGAWKKILHFTENAATLPEKVQNVTFDFGGSMRFLWKVELYLPVRKFYTRKVSEDCS